MSLKVDRVLLSVEINSNPAQQDLQKLDGELSKESKLLDNLRKQKEKVEQQKITSGDEGAKAKKALKLEELSAAIESQDAKVKSLKKDYDDYIEKMDITKLSVQQLTKRYKELKTITDNLDPNSAQYAKLKVELDSVNGRMKELRVSTDDTRMSLSKMADGFNKYSMIAASAVASLTGLSMTIRKCVQDYADMKEAEAQVSKYTGQTAEEVDAMNEQMKKMDTRTARAKLNELAGEAGKLGITGSKNILDFVNAGNQINVALGEDIGQDAVKTIGRLTQMFGDGKGSLKEGMLATGSAINQLAQSVGVDAPFLVEFESRLGGIAKQAGISQGQLLGFAGALNKNNQELEVSATTINQLISKMMLDPAKFAKLAGKSVGEFKKMLQTDVNGALLSLIQTLNKAGGMSKLAPLLNSMSLDGSRAVTVLSTLAGHIDDVTKQQKIATDAYKQGISITQEYNVQNNTVQAGIDKAKKQFLDLSVALGEKLQPVVMYTISTGSAMVKILSTLISFVSRHTTALIYLTSIIAAYNVAKGISIALTKSAIIEDKILYGIEFAMNTLYKVMKATVLAYTIVIDTLTLRTKQAKEAQLALNLVTKANPWGIVAATLTAVGGAILILTKRTKTLTDAELAEAIANKQISDSRKSANSAIAETKMKISVLTSVVNDHNRSLKDRISAGKELERMVPKYHADLKGTGELYRSNKKAVDDYVASLQKEALAEALKDKLVANMSKMYDAHEAVKAWNNAISFRKQRMSQKGHESDPLSFKLGPSTVIGFETNETHVKDRELLAADQAGLERNKKIENAMIAANNKIYAYAKEYKINKEDIATTVDNPLSPASSGGTGNGNGSGTGESGKGGSGSGGGADDKYNKAMQAAEEAYKKQVVELKKQKEDMTITDEKYHQKSYEQEIAYLGRKGDIQKKYGKSTVDTEGEILDKIISETDYQAGEKKKAAEKKLNDELAALDDKHGAEQIATAQQLMNGEIKDKEEYDAKLKNIEQQYWTEKLAIIKANGGDEKETLKQILDQEVADKVAAQQKAAEGVSDKIGATNSISAKNNINEEAYKADIINYQEYQKNKTQIAEEEEQQRQAITQEAFSTFDSLTSAASTLFSALQSRETSQVDAKYKKLIAAAKKQGKDTTKLEEKQEAEKMAIKKKYADKEFLLNILTINAKTAQGIMGVWAQWSGRPILAAALSAAVQAEGIIQMVAAKAQRDEAAGLYSGGYNDYAEGYTADGDPTDVAGVIPVHKREFVANHVATANPSVRKFLNVFDSGQKDGSIRMWNDADIMQKVGWGPQNGRYTGGYSSGQQTDGGQAMVMVSVADQTAMLDKMTTMAEYMRRVADESITLRDLRKNIKHEEKLEANASR